MCKTGNKSCPRLTLQYTELSVLQAHFPYFISLTSIIMYLGYASVHFMKHYYLRYVKHPVLNVSGNTVSEYRPNLKEFNILKRMVK